jgi:hypothetical protein
LRRPLQGTFPVTPGLITSQREQLIIARLSARLDMLVNRTFAHA